MQKYRITQEQFIVYFSADEQLKKISLENGYKNVHKIEVTNILHEENGVNADLVTYIFDKKCLLSVNATN